MTISNWIGVLILAMVALGIFTAIVCAVGFWYALGAVVVSVAITALIHIGDKLAFGG